MRTTLDLDDEGFEAAHHYAPEATKTELINEALRAFVQRQRQNELLAFRGRVAWRGDLDAMRERSALERADGG